MRGGAGSGIARYKNMLSRIDGELTIEATIEKDSNCDDHFIYLSTSPSKGFNFGTSSGRVLFVWDCGTAKLYSTSTTESKSCSSNREYTFTVKMTATDATWTINGCGTLTESHSLGEGPYYLFVGADTDSSSQAALFKSLTTSGTEDGSFTTISTGSTSASQCICNVGYYLDGSSCTSCGSGSTTESIGSTSLLDCICNAGFVFIDSGVCRVMCAGDDNSDCSCDVGFYQRQDNVCVKCGQGESSPVGSISSSACSPCSAGKYLYEPSDTRSICTDCEFGKYQPITAQTACADCEAGKAQSSRGASSCVDCSPGHYSNRTGLEDCFACDEGYYVGTNEAIECEACSAGTFTSSTGQTTCQDCIAGQESVDGAAACTSCGDGRWSNAGDASCIDCEGKYNREPDFHQEELKQCFCSAYDTSDKCSKGFYKKEIGSSLLCCPCSEATYQPSDNSDATSCTECSHPRQPSDNHDLCEEYSTFQGCDATTHVPLKLIMSDTEGNGWGGTQLKVKKTGVTDTLLEGTVGTVGGDKFAWGYKTGCIPKFATGFEKCFTVEFSGGQSSDKSEIRWEIFSATIDCLYPTQLEGGSVDDLTESTELRVCEDTSLIGDGRTGVYSSTPIDWCDVGHCPAGKFRVTPATNTEYGVSDVVNSCAPCVDGMYSDGVGDSCSVCPIGKMSGTRGAVTCDDCEGGKYNDDDATNRLEHVECTACGAGRYSAAVGSRECIVCQTDKVNIDAVAASCTQCEPGKFTVGTLVTDHDDADDCKICEPGEFWKMSESTCAACQAGKTSSTENKFECVECGAGRYSAR